MCLSHPGHTHRHRHTATARAERADAMGRGPSLPALPRSRAVRTCPTADVCSDCASPGCAHVTGFRSARSQRRILSSLRITPVQAAVAPAAPCESGERQAASDRVVAAALQLDQLGGQWYAISSASELRAGFVLPSVCATCEPKGPRQAVSGIQPKCRTRLVFPLRIPPHGSGRANAEQSEVVNVA